MSDKQLSEVEWKKFAKGRDLKDVSLVKALARLEGAEREGEEAQLKALDEVDKQAQALLKLHKADKDIATRLAALDKVLQKERLAAAQAAKMREKTEAKDAQDDDENPAVLSTRMVPLLREVAKGQTLPAMIALAGKDTAVLLSRKPIGPPMRKLLTTALGTTTGVKFLPAECTFEAKTHTFVVKASAGGLAKRLAAALLAQTGLRLRVRVRGEDPTDIDADGEEEQAQAPAVDKARSVPAADEGLAFNQRLAALMPRIKAALATPGTVSAGVKLKVSEAGEQARKKRFEQANALLDETERMLGASGKAAFDDQAFQQRWAQVRTAWPDALEEVNAQLSRLGKALRATGEPLGQQIADQGLSALTGRLRVGLQAALIDLESARPHQRAAAAGKARAAAQSMQRFLDTDPVLPLLESNPFGVMFTVRSRLTVALRAIDTACTP